MNTHDYTMIAAALLLIASSGPMACSTVESVTGKSAGVASKVEKTGKTMGAEAADGGLSSEAPGLSQKARAILKNVERIREKCPATEPPYDESASLGDKDQKIRWCEGSFERINTQVSEKFPTEERTRPEYADAQTYVASLENNTNEWRADWRAEKDSKQKADAKTKAFEKERRIHDTILLRLSKMKEGDGHLTTDADNIARNVEKAKALSTLADMCDKHSQYSTFFDADDYRHPENACDIAQNWQGFFEAHLLETIDKSISENVDILERGMAAITEHGAITGLVRERLEDPAGFKQEEMERFRPLFEQIGATFPAAKFDELVPPAEGFEARLAKAAEKNRWPKADAKHKDGDIKAAISDAAERADMKVVAYGVTESDWTIVKNASGYPIRRHRGAAVMTRTDGEAFCRVYRVRARSQFTDDGYTKPRVEIGDRTHQYHVSTCK